MDLADLRGMGFLDLARDRDTHTVQKKATHPSLVQSPEYESRHRTSVATCQDFPTGHQHSADCNPLHV